MDMHNSGLSSFHLYKLDTLLTLSGLGVDVAFWAISLHVLHLLIGLGFVVSSLFVLYFSLLFPPLVCLPFLFELSLFQTFVATDLLCSSASYGFTVVFIISLFLFFFSQRMSLHLYVLKFPLDSYNKTGDQNPQFRLFILHTLWYDTAEMRIKF